MKLMNVISTIVMCLSLAPVAHADIQDDINGMRRLINNNVSSEQRSMLNRALDRIERSAVGSCQMEDETRDDGKPVCDVEHNSGYYRIIKGGSAFGEYTKDLNSVLTSMITLRSTGLCSNRNVVSCDLEYNSGYYRLLRNGSSFMDYTKDLDMVLNTADQLRQARLCARTKPVACDIESNSGYFRVTRNGSAIQEYTRDQNAALQFLTKLRDNNLCR